MPANANLRCRNCGELIIHDTFDWVHWDGYYLCEGQKEKVAER